MPKRCSCGDTCACVILPGSGATVDGSGTPDHPYRIGVEGSTLTDKLIFDDDVAGTIDFTTTGTGTPTDPLHATAAAKIKLTQLTDVDKTAPSSGDVPTWQGDHWEFQAPPVVPPGAVNVSHGIGGVGSVGTPLTLLNALEWGAVSPALGQPGLNKWGADSLSGQPVYVDTAGKVRAAPLTIQDASAIDATALPGAYPIGASVMSIFSATALAKGWPFGASCTVVTFRRNGETDANANADQWWFRSLNGSNQMRYRFGNASGWNAWMQVGGMYSGLAAANATIALDSTAIIDIPGQTLTVPVLGTDSVFLVNQTFDVTALVVSGNIFIGRLAVAGGSGVSQQCLWLPGTGVNTGARQTVSQTWRVTGVPAGNVVFKGQASCSTANMFRVSSSHSLISVTQVA